MWHICEQLLRLFVPQNETDKVELEYLRNETTKFQTGPWPEGAWMKAAEHTFCFLTVVAESLSPSLSLQTQGSSLRHAPPAPSLSVWFMKSDLSDSRNLSVNFIHVFVWDAGKLFLVAYGNVLPPIIVHLVKWYHSPPPTHSPLICIQMTFLSGRLHHSPAMNEPPSFT